MNNFWDYLIPTAYWVTGAAAAASPIILMIYSGGGTMMIFLIILALLTVIVAVLIFLLMLGARLVIAVVCVGIAPVAFVLYVLPNTNKYFKKWWDLFKAVLIIYPICGVAMGVSYLIKAIVLMTDYNGGELHFLMYVVGIMAPFLPFFMLPTLLKNAISALGVMGAGLLSMGNTLKNSVSKATGTASDIMKQSAGYKNAQEDLARRKQEQYANRTISKISSKRDRNKKLGRDENYGISDARLRRGAQAEAILKKHQAEDEATQTAFAEKAAVGKTDKELEADWQKAFENNDGSLRAQRNLIAATNVWRQRSGAAASSDMAKYVDGLGVSVGSNKNYQNSLSTLGRLQSTDSGFAKDTLNKAGDFFDMLNKGGVVGRNEEGELSYGSLAEFSKKNNILKQNKDWATQSKATLQRSIENGVLTADTIKGLLNSDDPAIRSGLLSDKEKMKVLQDALGKMDRENSSGNNGGIRVVTNAQNNSNAGAAPDEVFNVQQNIEGPDGDGADGVSE